jgi:hypothetical protein
MPDPLRPASAPAQPPGPPRPIWPSRPWSGGRAAAGLLGVRAWDTLGSAPLFSRVPELLCAMAASAASAASRLALPLRRRRRPLPSAAASVRRLGCSPEPTKDARSTATPSWTFAAPARRLEAPERRLYTTVGHLQNTTAGRPFSKSGRSRSSPLLVSTPSRSS